MRPEPSSRQLSRVSSNGDDHVVLRRARIAPLSWTNERTDVLFVCK
jgi:hypothetical protein